MVEMSSLEDRATKEFSTFISKIICIYTETKSHLSEVPRMVFVHMDFVMVLTTSVTTTSRMLPVLSDPGQNICENRDVPDIS